MEGKIKILYTAAVPLLFNDGGSLVCFEHIRRLAAIDNVELHVCLIVSQNHDSLKQTMYNLGVHFHVIQIMHEPIIEESFLLGKIWPFSNQEKFARHSPNTNLEFNYLTKQIKPDVIILDYLMTALYIPSLFGFSTPLITITLNNEARFYSQMRASKRLEPEVSNSLMAKLRLIVFERFVYNSSNIVVALAKNDFPKLMNPRVKKYVIAPFLNKNELRWNFPTDFSLFYVGNIGHFPNYLAIQWLVESLAPLLLQAAPTIKIKIIGIPDADIPLHWQKSNVDFLGTASREDVIKHFINSSLFIVPIHNNFGSKMKVLECLSYGTPMIATKEALSGISFADSVPQFLLSDPKATVTLIKDLIFSEHKLKTLSDQLSNDYDKFCESQQRCWKDVIKRISFLPKRSTFLKRIWSYLLFPKNKNASKAWSNKLEVGTQKPNWVLTRGFYPLEKFNDSYLRWTQPISEINIPLDTKILPQTLKVSLLGITPHTELKIFANKVEIFNGEFNTAGLNTDLHLPVLTNNANLVLTLEASPTKFPNDSRELGVAIQSLKLQC